MRLQVTPAGESECPIIKHLVLYYVYDMSEYMKWNCNHEGKWDGCDDLPDYWEKADHAPYLIRVDGNIAGFALVRPFPEEPGRNEIAEFFVARKFKNQGVGRQSAFQLFDAYPGQWLVRVLAGNEGALRFWGKIVPEYTSGDFEVSDEDYIGPHSGSIPMRYYRFESRAQWQRKPAQTHSLDT